MADNPTAEEAIDIVIGWIDSETQKKQRPLHQKCKDAFRDGDEINPNKNLDLFKQKIAAWPSDNPKLKRTAELHGQICSLIADFVDITNGATSTIIDLNTFRMAGRIARAVCPLGSPSDDEAAAGGWCLWP